MGTVGQSYCLSHWFSHEGILVQRSSHEDIVHIRLDCPKWFGQLVMRMCEAEPKTAYSNSA